MNDDPVPSYPFIHSYLMNARAPGAVRLAVVEAEARSKDGSTTKYLSDRTGPNAMAALTPIANGESSPKQPQKVSCSPEDQWEDWMEWDPSMDRVSPSATSGEDLVKQTMANSQTQSTIKESFGSVTPSKKRKISEEPDSTPSSVQDSTGKSTSVQNKSHSLVEKRYRTNLNDKIAVLRQSVPSLRDDGQYPDDIPVLAPALKHNKATILTKAIEYIQHLEKRNAFLEDANSVLRNHQCDATITAREDRYIFEQDALKPRSNASGNSPNISQASTTTTDEPRGMIPVPEDIRKLRESAPPQPHYAEPMSYEVDAESTSSGNVSIRGGKFVGKLMLGSLAGLMIMDGFSGIRKEGRRDRGLFALPTSSLLPSLRLLRMPQAQLVTLPYGYFLVPLTRGFLVFAVLGIFLFLYLFNSKPRLRKRRITHGGSNTKSSTSPAKMRQDAWLTAIQTVWVPRHTMLPELWALILETYAYLTRQALGWRSYSWLTGRNEEDEIARVRAWEIAIDAQLVGGDSEMSRSRLVLTLWASGTLPVTPARLMLKALHIRITFWQASRFLWMTHAINYAGRHLAGSQWRLAQEIINNPRISKDPGPSDPLPDHLVSLLQQPIGEVMTDRAIRYAHNLAWNRELPDGLGEGDVGMQTEDTAMLGSLDALAVWISNTKLHSALLAFVDSSETDATRQSQLELAFRIAPPGSLSSLRALAATAALCEADRATNLARVMKDCRRPTSSATTASVPSDVCEDIDIVIDCARARDTLASSQNKLCALGTALEVLDRAGSVELLEFAATYQLMAELSEHPDLAGKAADRFNQMVVNKLMRLDEHMLQENDRCQRLREKYKAAMQRLVVRGSTRRRTSIASVDTGYGSMSDDDHRFWTLAAA